jgi:hypothetical protein
MIECFGACKVESGVFRDLFSHLRPHRAFWATASLCLTFALVLFPRLEATESQPEYVGIVLKFKGEWLLNGKPVVAGEKLPAGGNVGANPDPSQTRARKACDKDKDNSRNGAVGFIFWLDARVIMPISAKNVATRARLFRLLELDL